jgi:long-chain fatty acid transport protein
MSEAKASPLELYGFGARSSAMAGSGVASAHSFDCVFLNPAGLSRQRTRYLAAGLSYGKPNLRLNGKKSIADDTVATTFGIVLPLELGGGLRERLTLGFGVLVPQEAVARARAPEIGTPTFTLLDSRSEIVGLQFAAGYKINESWSVGAGMLALATLVGDIQVDVDGAGRFLTRSEQSIKSDYTPVLGVRYAKAGAKWRTGLTLRGSSSAGFDIEIKNSLGMSLPLSLPEFDIIGAPQYDPASAAAELSYQLNPALQLGLQLDYKHWSAFPLPTRNPIAIREELPDPDFHDTVVPRLSAEWLGHFGSTEMRARAGYAFFYSPAPEMTGQQSLLDNHRHLGAAGFGLAWPESDYPFRFDIWMQLHQLMARTHTKDPALFDDPMQIPESVRGTGRIAIGGFTLGVEL